METLGSFFELLFLDHIKGISGAPPTPLCKGDGGSVISLYHTYMCIFFLFCWYVWILKKRSEFDRYFTLLGALILQM